jgi:hypothetical protein
MYYVLWQWRKLRMVSVEQFGQDVQEFLEWRNCYSEQFDINLFIENEVGLMEEDMDRFVIWYSEKYNINMTGFVWNKHYKPEVFDLKDIFWRFPYEFFVGYSRDYLKFRDFFDAIQYGNWSKWLVTRKSRRGQPGTSFLSYLRDRLIRKAK